jgi:hypothetical protein
MKKLTPAALAGLLVMAALVAVVCAGCGSSTTTPTTPKTTTPAKTTPSTTPRSTIPSSDSSSSSTLPQYQPSSVVSQATGSLQLTSPSSVQQVTAFYDNAIARGGWTIVSNSKTAYSTNITATRGHVGTTLSVSSTGSGTYISLVTYPI